MSNSCNCDAHVTHKEHICRWPTDDPMNRLAHLIPMEDAAYIVLDKGTCAPGHVSMASTSTSKTVYCDVSFCSRVRVVKEEKICLFFTSIGQGRGCFRKCEKQEIDRHSHCNRECSLKDENPLPRPESFCTVQLYHVRSALSIPGEPPTLLIPTARNPEIA